MSCIISNLRFLTNVKSHGLPVSLTDFGNFSSQGSRPGDTMLTDIVRMFHKSQRLLPMIVQM